MSRHRRRILIAFGVLDALLFLRAAHQIVLGGITLDGRWPVWAIMLEVCRPVFAVSLAFSAFGFVMDRRWAGTLSYVQFPFRFVFMHLSFGFIGHLASIPRMPVSYQTLMITAMVLEYVRLAVTVAVRRRPTAGHG